MSIRELDVATLDNAAKDYAVYFIRNEGITINKKVKFDRDWVMLQIYNFTYKDEFEHIITRMKSYLRNDLLTDFEVRLAKLPPRQDTVFHTLLEEKKPVGYVPGTVLKA